MTVATTPAADWRTPAVVVTCGCIIAVLGFGVRADFGLLTAPLSADRGWGREVFALAVAIQNLIWGAAQPFAGALADRFGSFRVVSGGAALYIVGLILMTIAGPPALMHLSAGVLIGLGLAGVSFPILIAAFTRRVPPERRAWAAGMATAAGSLGQFLFPPLGQALILALGWPAMLLVFAGLIGLIPLLATALVGHPAAATPAASGADLGFRAALGQAFGHRSYLLLTAGFFVCGFHVAFITVHLPPFIADQGLGASLGAWAIALVGLFNVVGSYGAGILSGRYSKVWILSLLYFLRSVAIALFVLLPLSTASVLIFSAAIGILWLSTVPPTSGLVAVMFGTRYMATLFGIVFFSHQIGSFLGIWLGGLAYEIYGSYDPIWWAGVALGLFAALIHLPIAERPAPTLRPVAA